jgi:hypothetical protein
MTILKKKKQQPLKMKLQKLKAMRLPQKKRRMKRLRILKKRRSRTMSQKRILFLKEIAL